MHNIILNIQQLINAMIINKQHQTVAPMYIHKHLIMLIHYNLNSSLSKHNDSLIDYTCHHMHSYSRHMITTQLFHQALP